jgi:hypothetical protein
MPIQFVVYGMAAHRVAIGIENSPERFHNEKVNVSFKEGTGEEKDTIEISRWVFSGGWKEIERKTVRI